MENSENSSNIPDEESIQDIEDPTAPTLMMQKELTPDLNAKSENNVESSEIDFANLTQEMKETFEQIFQKFNKQGNLPQDLNMVIPEYFSHQVNWREYLYGYIATYAKSTYRFTPPNMKYLYRGIYLPSLSSDLLKIVICIDTSGSIDEKLLGIFLAEVNTIMQQYPNYEIDLITADAKIQSHKIFLAGEVLEYELSGGGGTDFRVVFEFIEQTIDYPTLLLYFTDGEGTFPQVEPSYDVLWIMPNEKAIPFGEKILLDK